MSPSAAACSPPYGPKISASSKTCTVRASPAAPCGSWNTRAASTTSRSRWSRASSSKHGCRRRRRSAASSHSRWIPRASCCCHRRAPHEAGSRRAGQGDRRVLGGARARRLLSAGLGESARPRRRLSHPARARRAALRRRRHARRLEGGPHREAHPGAVQGARAGLRLPAQRGPGREPPAVPLRRPHQTGLRERDLRRARARSRRRQARDRRRRARGGPLPSGPGDHRDARRPDRPAGARAGGQRAAEVLRARPAGAARHGPRPLGHRRARQRERRRGGRGPRRRGARTPAALGRVARRQAGRLRPPAQSRRPHHDGLVHPAVSHRARRPDPHRVRADRRRRGGLPVKRGGPLLLVLPSVVYLLVMFVYPFAYGVFLSLHPAKGAAGASLANYLAFFGDPWQLRTIAVTASIAVPNTIVTVVLALTVAYAMRRGIWAERTITALLVLPIALGTVLVAEGINGFYGPKGWLNQGLQAAGFGDPPRLTHNYTGVMIALFVQHFPFCFLMLLGYISGIDPALEASARVLGARPWVVFRRVMWPLIAPGAAIAFALVFVMNFGVFPSAVLVGQPAGATRTIAIAAYQQAFEHYDMSMASAIAVVMGLCQLLGLAIVVGLRGRLAGTGVATVGAGKR